MEKSINEYIKELKEMSAKSRFKETDSAEIIAVDENKPIGFLEISVTHSQNTFPVPNATFIVTDKKGTLLSKGTTDISGKSPKISLPAKQKTLSEEPGYQYKDSVMFYDVSINAENYVPFTIKNIPVFENITTLQNFDMTFFGASENGQPQTIILPTESNL